MTYEGEIPKSLIFMHHNPLILNVPVINEKLPQLNFISINTGYYLPAHNKLIKERARNNLNNWRRPVYVKIVVCLQGAET